MGWIAVAIVVVMALFTAVVGTYLLAQALRKDALPLRTDLKLSILVAARDEENAILPCLQALDALHYPKDLLQILVGDDQSSDRTAEIVQAFIQGKPHFEYHYISGSLGHLKGKQNVLAQLAEHADGEILLVTDADIEVHPDWAAGMAGAFEDPKTGIVCGPTLAWGATWFAKVQGLDWMMGQVLASAHTRLGIPISAVGNNMAVRARAYRAMGGYQALPFNIIEDYQLFQALCERGPWRYRMVFHLGLSALSLPMPHLPAWVRQRKRWFRGARGLAWYNLVLIVLNALVMPAIVAAAFVFPFPWFCGFLATKLCADFLFLLLGAIRLQKTRWLVWFLPYELYYVGSMVATPLLMLLPGKVVWKGRKY